MNTRTRADLLRRAHRWLGLAFSVAALMSASSGILHTVMSRTQAPPPPARATGPSLDPSRVAVSLPEAVAALPGPDAAIEAVNIRQIGGDPWYQVFRRGEAVPRYVDATTGDLGVDLDDAFAAQIAGDFLGGASVERTDYLERFDSEYIAIFRILPVHRFDVDDGRGTRVYVSTTTASVTRHTDDARQFEAATFSNLHKWMFIRDKDIRDAALVAATGGVLVASALGIALFFLTARPRRRVARSAAPSDAASPA